MAGFNGPGEIGLVLTTQRILHLIEIGQSAEAITSLNRWDGGGGMQAAIEQVKREFFQRAGDIPLVCIISPVDANSISQSAEIRDALRAALMPQHMLVGKNGIWNLPDYFYGVKLTVECQSIVGSDNTRRYAMPNGCAIVVPQVDYDRFMDVQTFSVPNALDHGRVMLIRGITGN